MFYRSSLPDIFCKKGFLEISENSQEHTCARVSNLIKLQARPATLLKKRLWNRCFSVNFAKFLRTPFLREHLRWLLLYLLLRFLQLLLQLAVVVRVYLKADHLVLCALFLPLMLASLCLFSPHIVLEVSLFCLSMISGQL